MKIISTNLPGVLIIEPNVFGDDRGFFLETYQKQRYFDAGIQYEFVQDNRSFSQKNVLRGLHFQKSKPQGKLVSVTKGEILDVVVDINPNSENFKRYVNVILSENNYKQLWVPPGFAHGFTVLSHNAEFHYKCTDYYDPQDEAGIIWNDSEININWPVSEPIMSDKDMQLPSLSTYLKSLNK